MLHCARQDGYGCNSMRKNIARRDSRRSLFRESAVHASGYRLFGEVSVAVPPSAGFAVLFGALIVGVLVVAVSIVEIPQRSRAVGVLMPAGGLIDVVASDSGRVRDVFVKAGEVVEAGERLLAVASGDASIQSRSLSEMRLRSLEHELSLRENAHQRKLIMSSDRIGLLDQELQAAAERQKLGRARLRAHAEELDVRERRLARQQLLMNEGHVTRDTLDVESAGLLGAQASVAENTQRAVSLAQEVRGLEQSKRALHHQITISALEHQVEVERVRRDIASAAHQVSGDYRLSDRRQVAHVLVHPGMAVDKGQVLAKLREPAGQMEAWLYVSTSSARLMRQGQSVEIRLDAYPQQVFGTFSASVSSISGVALLPREITVPLQIAGPVFEIRAELNDVSVESAGAEWPLQPGISFRADIVQQRLKLYEWLLRSLSGRSPAASANPGA